jgi:hypothetical protein
MSDLQPILDELREEQARLLTLWGQIALHRIRITEHPPGEPMTDITDGFAVSLKAAADALLKAITALEGSTGRRA